MSENMGTPVATHSVKVKVLDLQFFEQYGLPHYATSESAGLDLRACIQESVVIQPGYRQLIPTGLCIDLNHSGLMWVLVPKSGLGHKSGLVLGNLVGIIDSDYQQEVGVSVWNSGQQPITISRGNFVCQAVLVPVVRVQWHLVEEFNREVDRVGGWGSTMGKE